VTTRHWLRGTGRSMGNPEFRVRASGMGGSGYVRPPQDGESFKTVTNADGKKIRAVIGPDGKPMVVPGVTTVIKAFGDPPSLVQWKIDQVAAYAVANLDGLYNRTMDQGWGMLRFYPKRKPDLTDPLRTAHEGVVDDLAQLGTKMHEWSQADVNGGMYPPSDSDQMDQMIAAWKLWRFTTSVKPLMTEVTVYGDGYAGTFDGLWYIDGVLTLLDEKTSRTIGDGHKMQLAALRQAVLTGHYYVKTPGGFYTEMVVPTPEQYGFIQMRPDDDPHAQRQNAFVEFHKISEAELDMHLQKFQCALRVLQIDRELKRMGKPDSVNDDEKGKGNDDEQ
jgi:hypothetical protein